MVGQQGDQPDQGRAEAEALVPAPLNAEPAPAEHAADRVGAQLRPSDAAGHQLRAGRHREVALADAHVVGLEDHPGGLPPFFTDGKPNLTAIDEERKAYYSLAAYVDSEVGRMLAFLDDAGLANDTLVIFSADHGTMLFDHGIGNDKHTFHDPAWRVPLILRWPGKLTPGLRDFASGVDMPATILAAAGVSVPHGSSGMDLLSPLLKGQASPRRAGVGSEYRGFAVLGSRYKLSYFPEQDETFLFDRRDTAERRNLFGTEGYEQLGQSLQTALLRWRAQQDSIEWLQVHDPLRKNPPTAHLASMHTQQLRAADAEQRLQRDVVKAEQQHEKQRHFV